jgi:hypothetical protein
MARFSGWILAGGMLAAAASSAHAQVGISIGNPYRGAGVYVGSPGYLGGYGYNPYLAPGVGPFGVLNVPYVSPVYYGPYGYGGLPYGYGSVGYGVPYRPYGYAAPIRPYGGGYRPYGYGYRGYGGRRY